MKSKLMLMIALGLCVHLSHSQNVANMLAKKTDKGLGYLEYLPDDYATSTSKYPLLIFLHGSGETGNGTTDLSKVAVHGPTKEIKNGSKMKFTVNGKSYTFIVVAPQTSNSFIWDDALVDDMVNHAMKTYRVDMCKVYLTGLSLGGGGVWSYILNDTYTKTNRFAALGISDGFCPGVCWDPPSKGCKIAGFGLPVWAFHGQKDGTVTIDKEKPLIDAINACTKPVANPKAIYTVYPNDGHGVWTKAFDVTNAFNTPNLYEWMLSKSLANCDGPTGISQSLKSNEIEVFPNPIEDKSFNIRVNSGQSIKSITLYNGLNQRVELGEITDIGNYTYEVSNPNIDAPKGVYYLLIELGNGVTVSSKLLK